MFSKFKQSLPCTLLFTVLLSFFLLSLVACNDEFNELIGNEDEPEIEETSASAPEPIAELAPPPQAEEPKQPDELEKSEEPKNSEEPDDSGDADDSDDSDDSDDDPPDTGGKQKIMGSYRGIHEISGSTGKPVFRWTKPGGEYPDGLVVKWPGGSQKISDTSNYDPQYRCANLHWNPKSRSTTEWGGKLVVMLDCKFQGVKECWLEY